MGLLVTWKILKFHHIRLGKNKQRHFRHIQLSEGCTYFRTPTVNPFLRSFWGVNQLYKTGGSQDMENLQFHHYKSPKKQKKIIFVWGVYIFESTHSNLSLAVTFNQSTLYDQRFARFGFWTIFGLLGPFLAKKWVSPAFQPDHKVNLENRPSKDSKTTAVSEFAIIGQSPYSSTGLWVPNFNLNWQFRNFGPNLLKKGISGRKQKKWTLLWNFAYFNLTISNFSTKFAQ